MYIAKNISTPFKQNSQLLVYVHLYVYLEKISLNKNASILYHNKANHVFKPQKHSTDLQNLRTRKITLCFRKLFLDFSKMNLDFSKLKQRKNIAL